MKNFKPMQPGDVEATNAPTDALCRDVGFELRTSLAEGLAKWAAWYRTLDILPAVIASAGSCFTEGARWAFADFARLTSSPQVAARCPRANMLRAPTTSA